MGDLSKNFSRKEFACHCGCGFDDISLELIAVLQQLRDYYGKPVKINSACRCEKHNAKVGGAKHSKHKEGIAADVVVSGVLPKDVHKYLIEKYEGRYGIGRYNTFTHIDVRDGCARWG